VNKGKCSVQQLSLEQLPKKLQRPFHHNGYPLAQMVCWTLASTTRNCLQKLATMSAFKLLSIGMQVSDLVVEELSVAHLHSKYLPFAI
jgi:hypothetical protein